MTDTVVVAPTKLLTAREVRDTYFPGFHERWVHRNLAPLALRFNARVKRWRAGDVERYLAEKQG